MKSRYTGALIGSAITLAIIGALWWFFVGYWADANSRVWQWLTESLWGRGFWPNGWNLFGANAWAFLIVGILAGLVGVIWRDYELRVAYMASCLAVVLIVGSVFVWFASRNDRYQSWEDKTTFVVADMSNLDTNLQRLEGKSIKEGKFSQSWEPRKASATGADTVISRTSNSDSGSQLLKDTLTYTYGETEGWTAIRDGKKKQPLYGVAFWPGEGNVTTCRFTGEHKLTKALHGKWGQSLLDEIAGFNKSLFFDEQDMWGYCNDDQPVIVIPVKTWDGNGHRATWYSAGVLTITGSNSGKAQIKHVTDVKPGQFPGPVYPISLAADQRSESIWAAGYGNNWFHDFGYETTEVTSQAGNSSEFLLKSKSDGHLYWVTPLTARSSDSQLITAYSLIRADETTKGSVNAMQIHVLANDDPRVVNIDDLEARTRQAISEKNPGFFSAKGKLVEFLPLDAEHWQVYAEVGGRVVYRITVPTDSRIRPEVTSLDGIDETPVEDDKSDSPSQGKTAACEGDLEKKSDGELAQCLSAIAGVLEARQK